MRFEQLTRESDVRFYTGLRSTEAFRCLFDYLLPKAKNMQYWRGSKQTEKESQKIQHLSSNLRAGVVLAEQGPLES